MLGPPEYESATLDGNRGGADLDGRDAMRPIRYQKNPNVSIDIEPAVQPMRLWHSFATHGGGRCSHYIGDYRTALIEGLRYKQVYGGRVHLEVVR